MVERLPNKELLAEATEFYKAQKSWSKKATVSYVMVSEANTRIVDRSYGAPCHADIASGYGRKGGSKYVIHSVNTEYSDAEERFSKKNARVYYDYLFNRSPFRDAYLTKSAASVYTCGIAVSCYDNPQQISGMACKAIRHTWEKPRVVSSFISLVSSGLFSEDEAFFLSFMFQVKEDNSIHNIIETGHVTIYPNFLVKEALYNFCNYRKPKRFTEMHEVNRYDGVPRYWNTQELTPENRLTTWLGDHKSFSVFQGDKKLEVDPNPFNLLPELFVNREKGPNHFEVLRGLVDDLYAEVKASVKPEGKAAA